MKIDSIKIQDVIDWLTLKNQLEVYSFIGFFNFYHHFIKGFSNTAHLLHKLQFSKDEWKWEEWEQAAFNDIKKTMISASVLINLVNDQLYQVKVDSSDYASDAVLS